MFGPSRRLAVLGVAVVCSAGAAACSPDGVAPGLAAETVTASPVATVGPCPPAAGAVGYSDGLDKLAADGVTVGGLSSMARDNRTGAWASTVDNHDTDPARIWFFRDPLRPAVTGVPLVLRRPDGTPYDGKTADNEGLVVLPDGDYLVSSETEPSIRIFGRDGVQKSALPVPDRFAVAPAGQAGANASLEGLTIAPSGKRIVAAMEGALSGDTDATLRRLLVYEQTAGRWTLVKQVAYRAAAGRRIPEVVAYGQDSLLVMEAGFDKAKGNAVALYAVKGLDVAADVADVADLATVPTLVVPKIPVADLAGCPTLSAPARVPQTNPLLDNFEGMSVTPGNPSDTIALVSDDNFNPVQFTRLLTLTATLP